MMDLSGLNSAFAMVLGVLALVGAANLVDFGFRNVAQQKAQRAEHARFAKWGLPAPLPKPEPEPDEHLWHF